MVTLSDIRKLDDQITSLAEIVQKSFDGDMSENAAYQAQRDELERLIRNRNAQQERLNSIEAIDERNLYERIANAVGMEVTEQSLKMRRVYRCLGYVQVYTTVTVEPVDSYGQTIGEAITFTVVPASVDFEGLIAVNTPIAQAVLGHEPGDMVTVVLDTHQMHYIIKEVK